MKKPLIFKQHTWLIETIRRAGKISLADLNKLWKETEMSGGLPLSRATFNRQRDAILDMFGVISDCDRRSRGRYFIFNEQSWTMILCRTGCCLHSALVIC